MCNMTSSFQKLDRYWSINAPERSASDTTSGNGGGVRTRSRTASSNGVAESSVSGSTNVTVTTNASAASAAVSTTASTTSSTACSGSGVGSGGGTGGGGSNLATVECTIAGGATIRHYHICNDKRHVLVKDSNQNVALYDVLLVCAYFLPHFLATVQCFVVF